MRIDELVKGLNFLGLAYGKEYSQLEAQQVYEFMKEYDYETFIRATKDIIRTSKFLPKIADLIEACEKQKEAKKVEAIDYMKECGYDADKVFKEVMEERRGIYTLFDKYSRIYKYFDDWIVVKSDAEYKNMTEIIVKKSENVHVETCFW